MAFNITIKQLLYGICVGIIVFGYEAVSESSDLVYEPRPLAAGEFRHDNVHSNVHLVQKRWARQRHPLNVDHQRSLHKREIKDDNNRQLYDGAPIADDYNLPFGNGWNLRQPLGNGVSRLFPHGLHPGNIWNHRGQAVNDGRSPQGSHGGQFGNSWNHRHPFGNGLSNKGGQGIHFGNGVIHVGNHRPPFGGGNNHNGQHGGLNNHGNRPSLLLVPPTRPTKTPASVTKTPVPTEDPWANYETWLEGFQSRATGCGLGHRSESQSNLRLVGGSFGRIEDWPWMVSMYSELIKQPWCAGTLIADRWVVTAAHCFGGTEIPRDLLVTFTLEIDVNTARFRPFANPALWTLHFGKVNASGFAEYEREQVRTIEQLFLHPAYDQLARERSFDGDIALIKLNKPVQFTDTTSPICLARTPDILTDKQPTCTITGYGISNVTNVQQGRNVLHVADVPLVDKSTCRSLDGYGAEVTDNMICAGRVQGGVDTCQGDSGGPLQCRVGEHWHLVGVTSWGAKDYHNCGAAGKLGVYTDVSKYTAWVYSHIYLDYRLQQLDSKKN